MCTTVLAGFVEGRCGGRADRNITRISKAASPSPDPGCLLKLVLHSQEPSWDIDLYQNPVSGPRA